MFMHNKCDIAARACLDASRGIVKPIKKGWILQSFFCVALIFLCLYMASLPYEGEPKCVQSTLQVR